MGQSQLNRTPVFLGRGRAGAEFACLAGKRATIMRAWLW
jgi:hypothetical protein